MCGQIEVVVSEATGTSRVAAPEAEVAVTNGGTQFGGGKITHVGDGDDHGKVPGFGCWWVDDRDGVTAAQEPGNGFMGSDGGGKSNALEGFFD